MFAEKFTISSDEMIANHFIISLFDIITPPKTEKGIRRVLMPDFYADKMQAYIESLLLNENDRIFPFTKSYLHHEIRRGCATSGVKRIRIHGIRHSHISLLIDMGFSAVAIADRVGHESIDNYLSLCARVSIRADGSGVEIK